MSASAICSTPAVNAAVDLFRGLTGLQIDQIVQAAKAELGLTPNDFPGEKCRVCGSIRDYSGQCHCSTP